VWWCALIIPELRRRRQEDWQFEASTLIQNKTMSTVITKENSIRQVTKE
jgi:hypothetical protein